MTEIKSISPNLVVRSVEEAMEYYSSVFGFEKGPSVPSPGGGLQWGMVMSGGAQLMFQTAESIEEDLPDVPSRPVGGSFTLFIEVENAQGLLEKVRGKANLFMDLRQTFYGKWEFGVKDPNGYYLVFASDVK